MNYTTNTINAIQLLALCAAPFPTYACLSIRWLPQLSTLYHALLFGIYWMAYLTCIALVMGHTGMFSIQTLRLVTFLSLLPVLLPSCRRACVRAIQGSVSVALRISSSGYLYLTLATFTLLGAFAYLVTTTTTSEYDSQAYHLPFVFHWIQEQGFVVHPQFRQGLIGFYPANWEALCAIFVLIYHSDLLLLVPNLVLLLLYLVGAVSIGRSIGISDKATWSAYLLLSTTPIFRDNMLSLHVDLPLAVFFFASLSPLLNLRVLGTRVAICASAFSLTMMPGIKTTGIVYGGIAGLLLVITLARRLRGLRTHLGYCCVFGTVMVSLLLGASWYLRNLVLSDGLLGVAVNTGRIHNTTLLSVMNWLRLDDYKTLANACVNEFGLPFLALACAALLWFFTGARLTATQKARLVLPLLVAGGLFLITPYSGDNGTHNWRVTLWVGQAFRYGFPAIGILVLLIAQSFSGSRFEGVLEFTALSLCGLVSLTVPMAWVLVIGVMLLTAVCYTCRKQFAPRSSGGGGGAMLCIVAILLCSAGLKILDRKRASMRPPDVREIYDLLATRRITNIAYTRSHQGWIWYGERLNVTVSYAANGSTDEIVSLMKSKKSQALAMGPNTIPQADSTAVFRNLLEDARFHLVYGNWTSHSPVIFELRQKAPTSKSMQITPNDASDG